MKIDKKTLKKLRNNEERMLRGYINVLEGALTVGKYDKARHAMADIMSCSKNLEVMAGMSWEDNDD